MPNPSFQRTAKKLRVLPSGEFKRWAAQTGAVSIRMSVYTRKQGQYVAFIHKLHQDHAEKSLRRQPYSAQAR